MDNEELDGFSVTDGSGDADMGDDTADLQKINEDFETYNPDESVDLIPTDAEEDDAGVDAEENLGTEGGDADDATDSSSEEDLENR